MPRNSVRDWMRSSAMSVLAQPWLTPWLTHGGPRAVILMFHRFGTEGGVHAGHDIADVRRVLANLRRNRVAFLDVDDLLCQFGGSPDARPMAPLSVAVTVDDGYQDVVDVALPVFQEFDCPVTSYVVPQILDGAGWYWWDKLDWILRQLGGHGHQTTIGERTYTLEWRTTADRHALLESLCIELKRGTSESCEAYVRDLAVVTGITPPDENPPEYQVLRWEDACHAERRGMRFGAHSMSHAILSRTDEAQSQWEIEESGRQLQQRFANPAVSFCYPYGTLDTFGEREQRLTERSGFRYALSSEPGLLHSRSQVAGLSRYAIPRVGFSATVGSIQRLLIG